MVETMEKSTATYRIVELSPLFVQWICPTVIFCYNVCVGDIHPSMDLSSTAISIVRIYAGLNDSFWLDYK